MKSKRYIIIIAALIIMSPVKGQTKSPNISPLLENLYNKILYTNDDGERIRLNDSVRLIISSYVASDSVFEHKFTNLRYLGQVTSPDSRLKIINWNLILRDGSNRYFCFLIRKGDKGEQNRVYELTGENQEEAVRTDQTYTDKNWYGALYYSIQPFKKEKRTYYILLGIDYGNILITRKIIDVLSFPEGGSILFGNDCFVKGEDKNFREVLEYSSDGVMTLRLHSKKMIVFDHLVSFSDDQNEKPEYAGAEFTYDAYLLKKGVWKFIKNADVKNKK
ncbi:MAG: hypothetical protein MUC93_12455 [Bacteroidales bacterium]|jgi:hypothetical protein|nr:hypothetical protein [Bacteroidales bacterium]